MPINHKVFLIFSIAPTIKIHKTVTVTATVTGCLDISTYSYVTFLRVRVNIVAEETRKRILCVCFFLFASHCQLCKNIE
jgi:hypothetical protein